MTAVGADAPGARVRWLPEGCSVDGDLVTCPYGVLRRLVLAAAMAVQRARMFEEALRELEERCVAAQGLAERLARLESEIGWLNDELAKLERVAGELFELQPRVEELLREVGVARGEARRLLETVGRWRVVWECCYSLPHPETIRRRCRGNPRLCLLADRARRAKGEWYEFLWSLPALEHGEGRVLLFREVDARRLEETWRRLFERLVEELRREGYATRAGCRCTRRLMAPEQLAEEIEREVERLEAEIERLVKRASEVARAGRSATSILRRAELLRKRLEGLQKILRELREKLSRDARVARPTAVGTR